MALMSRADTRRMLVKLEEAYPDAKCALNFENPFQLLVATMLSAQSTDVRVNMVTARLFARYRGPEDFAEVSLEELGEQVRELGLWRAKSQNIIAMSRMLLTYYSGQVPTAQEDLVRLPGVGRKTANVVVSNAFATPALAVDTHVKRVCNRIGIANSMTPDIVEKQVCQRIPQKLWSQAHHWLIQHGRQVCSARNPKCETCPVSDVCKFYQTTLQTEPRVRAKVFVEVGPPPKKRRSRGQGSGKRPTDKRYAQED